MVGIVTGQGAGLERSSASVLGERGQIGSASMGRGGDQVYVNAATGNLIINRRDEFLVGRGPDTAYAQTYDSSGAPQFAWLQSVSRVLGAVTGTINTAGSTITRGDGDGHNSLYTYDAARGAYVTTEGGGAYDQLRYANGAWTWTDGNSRMSETYTALSGVPGFQFISSLVDADGNAQTYSWYSNGTIQRITNANGEYAEFIQTNGLTTQITTYSAGGAAMLTRMRYAWDSLRRLSSVTVDLSPTDLSIADGKTYTSTYTYEGSSARIATITQSDGSRLDIAYTQSGADYRVTRLTQTVSGGVTRVTGLYYDLTGRTTTITDPLGGAITMRYDMAGNLIQITHPVPSPGATAPTTSFTYNSNGDVVSVTEGGRTTTYAYDLNGNMTLSRDAAGNTVTRTYGSKNELLTSTEYLVADPDGGGSAAATAPVTTRYAYDVENHLRFKVSGDGRVTEFSYNTDGTLASTLRYTANFYDTTSLGPNSSIAEASLAAWATAIADKTTIERTDATYDFRGNVATVTTYSKSLSNGAGDLGSTYTRTIYVYDQTGNLVSRQLSGQGTETYLYDGLNRIVSATDAAGAVTSFTFNDAATTTTVTLGALTRVSVFDKAGERISDTQSGGDVVTAVTTEAYDALGRLRMTTDPTGRSVYYLYDSAGRKVADVAGDGAIVEYGYDSANRLVKTVGYTNRLSTSQIALLSGVSAGGAGGANAGGVSGAIGSTLMTNGSFEQSGSYTTTSTGRSNIDLPGWTKINPETFEQVSSGQMGVTASDGSYWLDLESIIKTGVVPVGSNLLVNGSFGQPGTYVDTATGRSSTTIPGWTKTNPETFETVASGQMGVTTADGGFWLDLESTVSPGPQAIGNNLLVNGSFETSGAYIQIGTGRANSSLPGWTKANPQAFEQVDADGSEIIGYDGAWYLDMDSVPSAAGMVPGVNLIVNGSFEESATSYTTTATGRDNAETLNIPGWVKANAQGFQQMDSGADGVAASDGDFYLDMEANPGAESRMDISQTIAGMTGGKQLTLKFDYANLAGLVPDGDGGFDNSGSLEVYWNGFLLGRVTAQDAAMTTKGFTVTSQAGDNVLRFKEIGIGGDAKGVYLDNVQLYEMVAAPNLIVNGGFEESATSYTTTSTGRMNGATLNIPGWTKTNSQGFEQINSGTSGVVATEGNFYLDMESGGGFDSRMDISQTISNMVGGEQLTLKFDFANMAGMIDDGEGGLDNSGSLEIWWNGVKIAVLGTQDQALTTKTYSVLSRVGDNVIRFREIGVTDGKGVWLDNVRLYANAGGNMDISQTVSGLAAGQLMKLQFDHAALPNVEDNIFAVYWNGQHVATIDDADIDETMRTKTFFLTAQAGNNTVRFVGLGTVDGVGAALDNVRLFATQTPPHGGNMDISQTVALAAGKMMLQFDHANRTTAESGSFEVWWNNVLIDTIAETGVTMRTKTYVVDAVAGNNILRFKGTGTVDADGASLDNVRLYATQPEPSGGNMDISQTVGGLAAGQVMQLSFDHANRTTTASGSFEVYWNNALVATIAETGTAMQTKTYMVTAVAGNNTLRFKSLGTVDNAGASVDNVRLLATQTGGPAGAGPVDPLAGLRPAAHALDDWTWNIYDSADRLIETIDGVGRATTFAYDGASRLASSTAYANAIAAATVAGFKSVTPTTTFLPTANAATDRATRSFYDSDGRLVGTLDGAGGLSQIFHDAAGRKIREIAYANPASSSLRASGTFAQLIANVGASASDRRVDYVYDRRGLIRYTVDALGHPTELVYDSGGRVVRTVDYAGTITTSGSYSLSYVQSQIGAWGLASNPATRIARTVYDGAGRAAFTIDAEGGTAAFGYDQLGNLIKETRYITPFTATADQTLSQMQSWAAGRSGDSGNRIIRHIYDSARRLAYTVDAEGFVTEHRYDAADRIVQTITYPSAYSVSDSATKTSLAAQIGAMPAAAVTTGYAYDSAGRLTDTTDGKGIVTRYVYDGLGQVTDEIVAYGIADSATLKRSYDSAGRVTAETRGYGTTEAATSSFGYDALGNLLTVTDARSFTTSRTYDALGHALTVTAPIDASTSAVVTHAYNRFGDLVQTTDARGNSTYNYYDRLGRGIAIRDAEDYVTETGYNVFGDVSSVTRRYNKANNSASAALIPTYVAHENDAATGFQYDRTGRLTRTTDAMGNYEQYTLNAFGDRVTVRNKLGGTVTNSYDERGQLLSETLPMQSVDMWGNILAYAVTNRFEYDARGNCTKRIEADGLAEARTTIWAYDKTDRLIETRRDSVTVLSQSDHASTTTVTPIETIKYDARGNVVETTDSNGARTLFYYDRLNRVITDISAAGALSTHVYDPNGNVTSTRAYANAVSLPSTPGGTPPAPPAGEYRETSFTYDRLNRLKTTSVAGVRTGAWNGSSFVTSTRTVTTTQEYDANGNITSTTDADGGISYFLYDKLNRAWGKIDPESWATVYIFDAEGNVTTERRYATPAFGVGTANPGVNTHADDRHTDFTYDRNGNRLTEKRAVAYHNIDIFGNLSATWGTVTISYTYNGLGQVTSKTEATGDYVGYGYDSTGRLLSETRSGYYDGDGYWVQPTVHYSYDGLNNLTLTEQGDSYFSYADRYTRYRYVEGGRLAQLIDANGASRYYAYDAAGTLLRESYYRQKADGSTPYEAILYGRDSLGRITSQALATWNGTGWTRGDTQNIAYNSFGEVAQRGLNGLWQEQFAYDNRGKLWRTNSGDGVWRYFMYDGRGGQTLAIESEGLDLSNRTLDQVLATATQNGAYAVGASYVDGLNATINVLDKRGMIVATRLPKRQLSEAGGLQDLAVSRGYNAFGEIAWEKDAKGAQTSYTYNTMGRTISIQRPLVWVRNENGGGANVTPVDQFHYDASGRLIGTTDANGNVTGRTLLAGTGYGGGEAQVTAERHSDGGLTRTFYDVFGDARILTNELMQSETRSYDAMGRLTGQTHRGGLSDYYSYDLLGQRTQHWNSVLYDTETTDYDLQGRVTRQVAFGGDTTTSIYYWQAFQTPGMGTFGGWTQVSTYANGFQSAVDIDVFGHEIYRRDLGNHEFYSSYDLAGRMTQRTGPETFNYTYLNGGALGSVSTGYGSPGYDYSLTKTVYGYDANGNKTSEKYWNEGGYWYYPDPYGPPMPPGPMPPEEGTSEDPDLSNPGGPPTLPPDPEDPPEEITIDVEEPSSQPEYFSYYTAYQDATASYDSLNRLSTWTETGNGATPPSYLFYEYDAAGNVRRTYTQYRTLSGTGAASSNVTVQDHWFRYDAMNRVVTDKGTLSGGAIVRSYTGTDYSYDQAGQRVRASRTVGTWGSVANPWYDPYDPYSDPYISQYYDAEQREDYSYDTAGNLSGVRVGQSGYYDNGDGTLTVTPPPATGDLKASYSYDTMGRLTRQIDWLWNGTNAGFDRSIFYNGKGQDYSETVITKQGSDTYTNYISNTFGSGVGYALGAIVSTTSSNYKNGSFQQTSRTDNSFYWYDGAVQATIQHKPNTSQSTTYTTSYSYTASGTLSSISVADGRPRSITFTNDMNGQVIRRDESDNNFSNGDPHEVWYRFNGKQLGYTGNNGTLDTDYQTSINNRTRTPGTGAFRFGTTTGSSYADFDQSVDPLTSYNQGGAGGSYTVRAGDTLASIAAQLWGDSSLWYKLAEANGMSAANALGEGQRLIIPAGVAKSRHNASTFKPYDPADVIGDASPSTPKPGKRGKCGTFGLVLLVVIAVAVTVITAGAAVAALAPASAAISGVGAGIGAFAGGAAVTGLSVGTMVAIGAGSAALGSIVSQGVGVATGIQTEFSWKAVGMAAIGGGVGAGLAGAFGIGNPIVRGTVQGVTSNALTQGIGVVTGLQDKFDWAGVAAAGIGGGVSGAFEGKLGGMNKYAAQGISSGAAAIASSAARTLFTGTSFGDNLLGALPDVIGTTIGNMIADSFAASYDRSQLRSRVNGLVNLDQLPEHLRGADATYELVSDAIATGVSNQSIRDILASGEVQELLAIRQGELDYELARASGELELVPAVFRPGEDGGSIMLVQDGFDRHLDWYVAKRLAQQSGGDAEDIYRQLRGLPSQGPRTLSSEHQTIMDLADDQSVAAGTREWTTREAISWKAGRSKIFAFKDQWVRGYRESIKAAARYYDLPPELLAGVAYNEVGGDPLWFDTAADMLRSGEKAEKTSFGNMSLQLRRAADTLGYTSRGPWQRAQIIASLMDPRTSIWIAAAHLSDLRDVDFRGVTTSDMTLGQIQVIATRYNRGPDLSLAKISQNLSYGERVTFRLYHFRELLRGR
jgi:YD repeat-containing protein